MRPLIRLARKGLSWSSIGQTFEQPPFWARTPLFAAGPVLGDREAIEANFEGYVQQAYKANGIVFACVLARMMVFSQARFQYQQIVAGRPGDLFDGPALSILETPWPNATTGELLGRMEQDGGSLAGNFFATTVDDASSRRIRRLRPDWVTIITGSPSDDPFDIEAKPVGYLYHPRNTGLRESKATLLTPDQVVHWSPIPDPEAQWRGMSWLTTVVREVEGDNAATKHKLKFFENGATANFVVTYDSGLTKPQFDEFVAAWKQQHEGVDQAYKTIHLGGGAAVETVGADLKQLDFKVTQGAGESRIAAASGVGAVVAQFSEGMAGSSLNAGNYSAARRRFGDVTIRPLWQSAASALAKWVDVPAGARLWYDDRDIPFLREDAKDAAGILKEQALTVESFVRAGYTPGSAVAAVKAGDIALLEHTGLFSVQLQPPGTQTPSPQEAA